MNKGKRKLPVLIFSLIIGIIALVAFLASCHKSDSDTSTVVAGTYYGTLLVGSYSEGDTVIITGTSSDLLISSKTSLGSSYNIHATASGSSISIASQSVYVSALGATYTVTGSGSLAGTNLLLNFAFKSASGVTTNSTFTGTKQ